MTPMMRAFQFEAPGEPPRLVEVPVPTPGPGQVLLKVSAAGVCHSDLAIMAMPVEQMKVLRLPLTLGHEGAGTVVELGLGVDTVAIGDEVAVYGPWGCGVCAACEEGKENYCRNAARLRLRPPGLGEPGAIAEYMIVDDPRHLVPLDGLDPVQAAPITDAGLTSYHAIKRSLGKLTPGSTAVVIGVGGLGHMAVQILRAMTTARVIAVDVSEAKLALAREVGAHEALLSDADAKRRIRELTGGGAELVLDFVGANATASLAGAVAAAEADVAIVGLGGGTLGVGFLATAHEVNVAAPYWGSRSELREVMALARSGAISSHVEVFAMDDVAEAYRRLENGDIEGRAVILPNG